MIQASWQLVTGPTVEPLTTAEAKSHLRVDVTDDDTLIDALVKAARQRLEEETSRAFITQTWRLNLSSWPCHGIIRLPRPPLATVVSVIYTDVDGVARTWAATNYHTLLTMEPGAIVLPPLGGWPGESLYTGLPIAVQYTCGYGATAASVPEPLRVALRMLLGHWYENREAVAVAAMQVLKLPMSVEWLLDPYRMPLQEYP